MSELEAWKARAIAAEKTVDVLKDKVWALYNGASRSPMQRQLERAEQRQERARRRRELTEIRAAELARYTATLEVTLEERTRDIRTILDHVASGFLLMGPDLVVRPGFTRSCHRLFESDVIAGKKLVDLLRLDGPKMREHVELAFAQIFDDVLPEEVTVDLVPRRFPVGSRVLALETSVIRTESAVTGVLLTVNDVTSLEEAQRKVHANEMLVGILAQRPAFQAFVVETRAMLSAAREAVGAGQEVFVRRALHTVKGNSAAFDLFELSDFIHEVEGHTVDEAAIAAIEAKLRAFLDEHGAVLGVAWDTSEHDSYEVSGAMLDALRAVATDPSAVERWARRLSLKRAGQVAGPLGHYVARLGERLDKQVAFVLRGGDVLIDGRHLRPVLQNITHALRNSVDHGFEPARARGGKGRLEVAFEDAGDSWRIEIADDGQGIDEERVARAAVRRKLVTEAQLARMTKDERLALVFIDGLSTREVATDLSGRGVGMSAMKAAVERLGGTVSIWSEQGCGTRITLAVPKPLLPSAPVSRSRFPHRTYDSVGPAE